jgi:hypothetical protein
VGWAGKDRQFVLGWVGFGVGLYLLAGLNESSPIPKNWLSSPRKFVS